MTRPTEHPIVEAFAGLMIDLSRLARSDLEVDGLHSIIRDLDLELMQLCDAVEQTAVGTGIRDLMRRPYLVVLELGQLLADVESDDHWTRDRLEFTRLGIDDVLDALAPYVSHADRALRRVLIEGESVESALLAIRWRARSP